MLKRLMFVILLCVAACSPVLESTSESAQAVVTLEDGDDTLENMAVGFHRVDSSWHILTANAHELATMHCTSAQYIGHSIVDFHANLATITTMAGILAGGGELHAYPAELVRCDGGRIFTLIWSSTYKSDPNAAPEDFDHTRCVTGEASEDIYKKRRDELGLD
jgi:hypothetical protein